MAGQNIGKADKGVEFEEEANWVRQPNVCTHAVSGAAKLRFQQQHDKDDEANYLRYTADLSQFPRTHVDTPLYISFANAMFVAWRFSSQTKLYGAAACA
jgi:hypothetical protein